MRYRALERLPHTIGDGIVKAGEVVVGLEESIRARPR